MYRIEIENDSALYALRDALHDAARATVRTADTFRNDASLPEHARERLARSCEDRAQVIRAVIVECNKAEERGHD